MSPAPRYRRGLALLAAGLGAFALYRLRRSGREVSFDGKVALITGGSRGLGLLLARELAREGCNVAICARDPQQLERAQRFLERHGCHTLALPCDVGNRQEMERTVAQVVDQLGRLDILVNNAGIMDVGPVQHMDVSDFERAMSVMFWGLLYSTLAARPHMLRQGGGWVVNITSIGGKMSVPHLLPYGAAKFAATGLSEGLRTELLDEGIRVVTVVPGLMRTGSHLNAFFRGRDEAEFAWFGLSASLPIISMDAEKAARQIVDAAKRGQAEIILTLPAQIATRFQGLFPGITSDLLAWLNRLILPSPGGAGPTAARGGELQDRLGSSLLDGLTRLGRNAALRFQEHGEESTGAGTGAE